jgi:putative methanogenesis marker protein 3
MAVIHLDGERIEVRDKSRLSDIVPAIPDGCCVAVIRPAVQERERTNALTIATTAGEVRIEVEGDRAAFLEAPGAAAALLLHWHDRYAAAFGPFSSSLRPVRKPGVYERGDVILGCGGYDPKRSYLIFSKTRHSADHGADESGGVIGRVVAGRAVLDRWVESDRVEKVEPVISWADTSRSFTTAKTDIPLEDGMQIITKVVIIAQGCLPGRITTEAAGSVEHMLLALDGGRFTVSRATSTHILDAGTPATEGVPAEHRNPRREGTVTVRNSGELKGGVYLYREDVHSSPAHSVTGQVVKGIELIRLAKEGDVFVTEVRPRRIDLLGLPLERAQEILNERNCTLKTDNSGSGRIVVSQEPATTLDILKERSVTVTTAPFEKVVDIELCDAVAPASCAIFRRLTGLNEHDAGSLALFMKFDDVFLFKPKIPAGLKINPENTPEGEVPEASIAITNDSRKISGMIGVRLSPNKEFGPTSEPFEGTNLIGRVIDTGKLKGFKERDLVYIREARK